MNLKECIKNFPSILKKVGKIVIIIIAIVAGFATSEIYNRYNDKVKSSTMQTPKGDNEISVAINECGEILIIDRKTGEYQLYSDKVGKMFFDLYSNRMLYNSTKPIN